MILDPYFRFLIQVQSTKSFKFSDKWASDNCKLKFENVAQQTKQHVRNYELRNKHFAREC